MSNVQSNDSEGKTTPAVDSTPISGGSGLSRKDSLETHLQTRPDRAELVEKNILPESTAAPGLLAHQKELKRHMIEDQLSDKLSHRPEPNELLEKGVLQADPRSADEKYAEAIEDEYAKREGGA